MRVELNRFDNPDALARAGAGAWLDQVAAAHSVGKPHHVALSGGRIAQTFFAAVVELAKPRVVSFEGVHFFWADERCVPPTDKESNFRVAQELLFAPLKISKLQIHNLRGEESPDAAAKSAETEIRGLLPPNPDGQPVLDLVFLGLGEDGHVASLFPGEPEELMRSEAVYRAVTNSPKPPPWRITLGYPALAAARQAWVLASGAGKEAALRESLSSNGQTPLARVLKLRSHTKILTDIPLK